ncbi:nucleotidyl transferase AbiEii/AbiGii toxin family protein [Nitratireductor sp. StC3]|uniref:nucleotidyl transferase AbiEii/AbiGii toxin family protein n=1 Tax=Nitratireductor sp. StC3 TaxID=2126741 RepID=UPI000D0CF0D1|nr:nucleotidyl transferase AbiEii/AbiGii toxin family protein [Nitratireductor sp. StC3]PSM15915.1 hypothetical protein C7T96_22865 [Nitratireductor sp. StC3]
MTTKPPLKNVGASVRARLTRRASAAKENVQLALTRFAIERLLYRLSLSPHRDQFVLKGAMLFSLWTPTPYRATGDLDLLGYGDAAPERIATAFREICRIDVEDDGVVFKPETLRAEPARAEDEYSGVRVTMTAEIAGARLPIQIDIGFGDAITPTVQEIDYPSLLDMPQRDGADAFYLTAFGQEPAGGLWRAGTGTPPGRANKAGTDGAGPSARTHRRMPCRPGCAVTPSYWHLS